MQDAISHLEFERYLNTAMCPRADVSRYRFVLFSKCAEEGTTWPGGYVDQNAGVQAIARPNPHAWSPC